MAGEDSQPLRAWVDYYRDLGIYDFYRNGEPVEAVAEVSSAAAVEGLGDSVGRPAEKQIPFGNDKKEVEKQIPFGNDKRYEAVVGHRLVSLNDLAAMPVEAVPAEERAGALQAILDEIGDCTRCPLAYAGRRKIVFGDGSPTARLMFVGEGPGADEDTQGVPFVGKAGQLLNNMIAAMVTRREDVYIANIVKCRPPANRVPEPVEANTCTQFLVRQIDVVRPEVIVALGATAAQYLLGVKQSLGSLRGQWYECRGAKVAVTYHPAFLLRDPRQKAEAWKDLQMVMAELGLKPPVRG